MHVLVIASTVLLAAAVLQANSLTAVRDSYPDLSPDGTKLLFQSNRSGRQSLWLADPDGSGPVLLFDGSELGMDPATPRWSPDGRLIVFAMKPAGATDENESEIYLMQRDGSHVRRLTNAPGDDSHPHWTVDGKRIFFNSARATPDLKADWSKQWIDIYSVDANGSDLRRHTHCGSVCTYPVPSPDGRFVAYRKIVDSAGFDWSLQSAGRNSDVVVGRIGQGASVNVSDSPAFDGWPMWSPDGRWLVFASNRDRLANVGQIYAVRPDGSGLRRVTSGSISRAQPSFSADGKHLYVYENLETSDFEIGHLAQFKVSLPE